MKLAMYVLGGDEIKVAARKEGLTLRRAWYLLNRISKT